MLFQKWKKELLTIPNFLSLLRIALIPLYLIVYLHAEQPSHFLAAGMILAFSCLTDLIDGKIARKYNMISTTGKLLDPAADKATQFSLTFCLSRHYPVLWAVLLLLILKETFQLTACIHAYNRGRQLPGALRAGKVCTAVFFTSLISMVLFPELSSGMVNIIAGIDAAFLLFSFLSYAQAYYGKNRKTQDFQCK